ncbi:MAG: sigma-70 family RNA polymerase sigma factor [Armatimonadetes bacterium]|nr:sigma-70 family RNA polymerase sigma factor [Armatimonadota bacterium]
MYERRIYGVALRLSENQDDAADLTQEAFLRAFRGWKNFRKESQAYTWLYRILVNLNKDRIGREARKREKETMSLSDDSAESAKALFDTGPTPDQSAETGEIRGMLMRAIRDLQPGYRECIVLKDIEGLSYEQIAEVMGITVEAVRSRLARARQQLRQTLAPHLKA